MADLAECADVRGVGAGRIASAGVVDGEVDRSLEPRGAALLDGVASSAVVLAAFSLTLALEACPYVANPPGEA